MVGKPDRLRPTPVMTAKATHINVNGTVSVEELKHEAAVAAVASLGEQVTR